MRSWQLKIFRFMSRNTLCLMSYLSYKTKYRGEKNNCIINHLHRYNTFFFSKQKDRILFVIQRGIYIYIYMYVCMYVCMYVEGRELLNSQSAMD